MKMKNIKYIILLLSVTAIVSCNDTIDIAQPGEFEAGAAYNTVADLQTGIFGVYIAMNPNTEIQFASIFTDETSRGEGNGGQGFSNDAPATFQLNPATGFVSSLWLNNYGALNRANILLEAAARITPADAAEQEVYNKVVAEALTIRAYSHMTLLAYYAPNLNDPNSVGVIIADRVIGIQEKPARNTVGEVSAFIRTDLNDAEVLLSGLATAPTNAQRNFIDVDVVRAMRARFSVYVKDYVTAEAQADLVLASRGSTARSNFPLLWTETSTQGVVFKATRIDGNAAIAATYFTNATSFAGSAIYEMSRNVYNALAVNPTDIRFIRTGTNAYLDQSTVADPNYTTSASPITTDLLIINKYPGNPALVSLLTNDIKMFRSAEMTFIKIEARIAAGDRTGAATLMQNLRLERYTTATLPTYASDQAAYADLVDERRLELWLEGHRYMDIKRLGALANRGYDRNQTDCIASGIPSACDLSFNDIRTQYLPIPNGEVAGNPNVQQNPGY
jgi:dUTPase